MEQLTTYIKSHGHEAVPGVHHILAGAPVCNPLTGETWTEWTILTPTVRAVREWLGY